MRQKKQGNRVGVIIAAAGASKRMGTSASKVLLPLAGKPVLAHSLETFSSIEEITSIIVAAPKRFLGQFRAISRDFPHVKVTAGGATRIESVSKAASLLPDNIAFIAVHDGARPFFTPALFRRVLRKAAKTGAAAPGIAPSDTVKQIDETGDVLATLKRENVALVQTPQIFRAELFNEALTEAFKSGGVYTDDLAMIEAVGGIPLIVPGDRRNIKITFPEDISIAELIIGGTK
jgi:2-C-methyl-D-erythritol 4-phosphate cytidylyltransferase